MGGEEKGLRMRDTDREKETDRCSQREGNQPKPGLPRPWPWLEGQEGLGCKRRD